MGFRIAMLLCLLHASLSLYAVARKDTTAGDWVIDTPTSYSASITLGRVADTHRNDTNLRNVSLLSFFDINILY